MQFMKNQKSSATLKLEVSICRENVEHMSDGDESESKIICRLLAIVARHEEISLVRPSGTQNLISGVPLGALYALVGVQSAVCGHH
jgi:hypothetical protein